MAQVHKQKQGRTLVLTLEGDTDLNIGMISDDLHQSLTEYDKDDELWCCIVTGAGTRAFSAGGNLTRMAESGQPPGGRTSVFARPDEPNIIGGQKIWKPIIAAINGHCIGAGCMFALACDIRIASENAELGIPEIRYGFAPGLGAPQRLPRLISLGPALEMLLTGNRISAQQALQWGLVNRVVPQAQLMDAAMDLATRITNQPPLAVRATKELVYRSRDMSIEDGMRMSGLFGAIARNTEDAKEGMKAFTEKRKPVFQGR